MKLRTVWNFCSDLEIWIDDVKRFTLLKPGKVRDDNYLAVMFEIEPDSKEYGKEIAVVPRRFGSYETEEAICSIARDLSFRGYASKVSYLLPETFALEG